MKEWTTPNCRNTPSNINVEEEEIADALKRRQCVDAGTGQKIYSMEEEDDDDVDDDDGDGKNIKYI